MDFSPFSLLVVKVFSLITGGLGAEACAQILKVPLEELEPIIADLKEGGLLQSDPDRPARIMITSRGVAELQIRNAWREVCAEIADVASALDEGQNLEACTLLLGFINTLLNSSQSSGAVACYGLVLRLVEPGGCRLRSETGLHEAGARGLRHFHVSLQKPSSGKGDRRQSP